MYVVRLWDPEPWWHLATGRFIVEHHAIPAVDPFSFTMAGAPWRAVDWLADLVMYGAWRLGGDAGLGALTALSAFAMLLLLFVRRRFVAALPAGVLALDELRFCDDARWLDSWYAAVAADPVRAARLEAEVVRAVALCPTSRTLHAALVCLGGAQPALAERPKRALESSSR